jgi:hypothetical protein
MCISVLPTWMKQVQLLILVFAGTPFDSCTKSIRKYTLWIDLCLDEKCDNIFTRKMKALILT